MNKKQIDLLIKNGYEVLPEVGFIRETTLLKPNATIWFNTLSKQFTLNIFGTEVSSNNIVEYMDDINNKCKLVNELNKLGK